MKLRYFLLMVLFVSVQKINAEIITLTGVYTGLNLYLENAFNGSESCVKEVYVNDKKVKVDISQKFFEIDFSFLQLDNPVAVKILCSSGCKPKILNSDVLKIGGGFKFVNLNLELNKIQWLTKREKPGGKFFIEQLVGNNWKQIAELKGKSSTIINVYEMSFSHKQGNQYRIKYKEPEGVIYCSQTLEYKSK